VPGDAPALARLTGRLGESFIPPWRNPADVASADLRQMLRYLERPRDNALILLAMEGAAPAGCIFISTETDFFTGRPQAHLEVVAVSPDAEGQGLARQLIEAGEAWARSRAIDQMTLNVFVGNTRARGVYEHLGYVAETIRYRKEL
jgi:GNAT superfamily N-acetyltransferase